MASASFVSVAPQQPRIDIPKRPNLVNERFELSPKLQEGLRSRRPNWGFGQLSQAVYYRSYSRQKQDGRQEQWADTIIRVVEGVMAIRKDWYKNVLGKRWDDKKYQTIAAQLAAFMFDMKVLPPGRGLWAMGTDYVFERGSHSLNNCLGPDEPIITRGGVLPIGKLVDQDVEVLTQGGWEPAKVHSFGRQRLQRITFAPAVLNGHKVRSNHRVDIEATPDHRWILADGSETTELSLGDLVPAVVNRDENRGEEYKGGFVHGMVFGDGTRDHFVASNGSLRFHIRLCGRSKEQAWRFDNVTQPPSANGDYVAHLKSVTDLKSLPDTDLGIEYLRGFLEGWLEADAHTDRFESFQLDTQDALAAEWAIQHAAQLGYLVTGNHIERRATNYGERKHPLNRITMTKQPRLWKVEAIFKEDHETEVFCAVVPGSHAFTLGAGVYTGNCGYREVTDDLADSASWLMDSLMCGVGVGFSTHTARLQDFHVPLSNGHLPPYVVPDSREGWVEATRMLIDSYEKPGRHEVHFDYSEIRSKGQPLKGFGGISSGAEPLIKLHERVRSYLDAHVGIGTSQTRLIVDTMNAIGACVVAGNIRRSAEIALGSPLDTEFLNLKNYDLYPERKDISWMSNNSVVLTDREHFSALPEIAKLVQSNGEPGILNMLNARKYGRIGDRMEDDVTGVNPCAEIFLESSELCNLVEVFPTRCQDDAEVYAAMKLATFYASTVSLLRSHSTETNEVVSRNRRIGVSVSGIADWIDSTNVSHVFDVLNVGYEQVVRPTNTQLAKDAGVPASIRVTTVKPSGSISLLAGVSAGMHHPLDGYVLRRMRIATESPVSDVLRTSGVPHEEDTYSDDTTVFEFPLKYGNGTTRSVKKVSIYEQAAVVAMLQKAWADNAVSNTLTVQPHEFDQIERVLALFAPQVKSLSLLPDVEGTYEQMPLEKITKVQHHDLSAKMGEPDWSGIIGDSTESRFCDTDACETPQ